MRIGKKKKRAGAEPLEMDVGCGCSAYGRITSGFTGSPGVVAPTERIKFGASGARVTPNIWFRAN